MAEISEETTGRPRVRRLADPIREGTMAISTPRGRARLGALLTAALLLGLTPPASASANGLTPVMAPPVLNQDHLLSWWRTTAPSTICNQSRVVDGRWECTERVPYEFRAADGEITPRRLIRLFLEEGAREGVRGDVAFIQSVLETAWFYFPDSGQVRPTDNNFAGIGAVDGGDGRSVATFRSPRIGVRAQIQHLRGYADPTVAADGSNLASPLESPRFHLIHWSNRGQTRYWEQFGGTSTAGAVTWASDPYYWPKIRNHYAGALRHNGFSVDAATWRPWYRRNSLSGGGAHGTAFMGSSSAHKLACDFSGNGRTTPASFEAGRWVISNRPNAGTPLTTISYGRRGDLPLCGDFNGDGRDTIGIVRDGTWHLKHRLAGGRADQSFSYGRVSRGDVPLVGDWNGDGRDGIGVVRDGTWHLRQRASGGPGQIAFTYGRVVRGDLPLVGDFNGDGRDTPAVVRDGTWHLKHRLAGGRADHSFTYGRVSRGDLPLLGDWNANGTDTPAVVR